MWDISKSSAEGSFVKKWTGEPQGQYSTLKWYQRRAIPCCSDQKAQGAKWNPEERGCPEGSSDPGKRGSIFCGAPHYQILLKASRHRGPGDASHPSQPPGPRTERGLGASKDPQAQSSSLMCFQQQLRNQLFRETWCWQNGFFCTTPVYTMFRNKLFLAALCGRSDLNSPTRVKTPPPPPAVELWS